MQKKTMNNNGNIVVIPTMSKKRDFFLLIWCFDATVAQLLIVD